MELTYKVGDLKKLIEESSNEFKARLGANVESEDKKNNGKAYKESEKRARDYDGGLKKEVDEEKTTYEKEDANKTTLDYNIENASDEYKKRVHAQVKGYTSVDEMENGIEKTGNFSNNDNIYKGIKKCGQEMHANEEDFKKTGLQASKMPAKTFVRGEMYESKEGVDMRNTINALRQTTTLPVPVLKENKQLKTIYFKKTAFLTEGHMISRIPDEFKKDGEQFKMKDKNSTEYIVEWNQGKAHVLSYVNKQKVNESFNKFKKLSNFSLNENNSTSTPSSRINEEGNINRMLEIMRNINKED